VKEFIGHEPCPQCGSKDNVGVWSNGQKYCFSSCGYYVPAHSGLNVDLIRERLSEEAKRTKTGGAVSLPVDYSVVIRGDAVRFLQKYGITDAERIKYKIGWSDLYESLVLPAYDKFGNLLLCQRRYFGTEKFPRFHTRGQPEKVVWTVGPDIPVSGDSGNDISKTLVLVEDYISCLKVGRHQECTLLWGSSFSDNKLIQIADRWENIIFWLDFDKTKETMKYRSRAAPYFREANMIVTERDPKDYTNAEIAEYLKLVGPE
jgi:Zn ribbon nucleic-acid-binding protein